MKICINMYMYINMQTILVIANLCPYPFCKLHSKQKKIPIIYTEMYSKSLIAIKLVIHHAHPCQVMANKLVSAHPWFLRVS